MNVAHARRLRTIAPYEPQPGVPAARGCDGQLAISTRSQPVIVPAPRPSDLPPAPTERELCRLLAALVEVVDGRRAVDPLRRRLSADLQRELRGTDRLGLDQRFVVKKVHVDASQPGTLEVCATVHALPRGWAFTAAGRLQAFWHGWTFTEFGVIPPPSHGAQRLAAA